MPRMLKLSGKLLAMLATLSRRNEYVFGGGDLDNFARWFFMKRKELAAKLGNPRIQRIGFKTYRH